MNKTTFPKSFRLRVGRHKGLIATAKLCRNAIHNTTYVSEDRVQPRSRTTCVGWLARFKGLMSSMQDVPCHTMRQFHEELNKRNRQLSWNANRLIPKHGHILLHRVFLRLKVQIEDEHLPCFFLFGLSLCLLPIFSLAVLVSGWQVRKSLPERQFCPFEKPFLSLFPLDHQAQSGSCACSSPRNNLPFPFNLPLPFPFCLTSSTPHLATFRQSGLPSIVFVVICPKTRPFITYVTLLISYFAFGLVSKFVLSIFFYNEASVHPASVSVHSE